jgi:hypothetical protein
MPKKPTITERGTVEHERDGRKYVGSYAVAGQRHVRTITVSFEGGSKTAQVGGTPVNAIALQLLLELIRDP